MFRVNDMDEIKWLEEWMRGECNGDWEHCYGIKICTLDNPGWWVQIDLMETNLFGKHFETYANYIDDNNWIHCQVKDNQFDAGGDLSKLKELINVFKNWVES